MSPGPSDRPRGFAPAVGALLCVLAAAAAGCVYTGSAPPTPTAAPAASSAGPSSSTASPPSVGPSGTFWLAVLAVAEEPDALDHDTQRLAPVLGGALVVSPVACFTSMPAVAGSGYVLAAAGADRVALDDLLAAHDLTPRFVVRTRSGCVD